MSFEDWAKWKENQTSPTCDHVGCHNKPVWNLPKSGTYFCQLHGSLHSLEKDYGETPIYLGKKIRCPKCGTVFDLIEGEG